MRAGFLHPWKSVLPPRPAFGCSTPSTLPPGEQVALNLPSPLC